jgi:hypothetical protein
MSKSKIVLALVGFLAVAGVIGYVATSGLPGSLRGAGAPSAAATRAPTKNLQGHLEAVPGVPAAAPGDLSGSGGSLSSVGNLPPVGPYIVKTAQISVEVKKDGFETAFDTATMIAGRYGGYVQDSSSQGTEAKSGELTIRIPASSFEQAMNDLRRLGSVRSQSVSGQDVTSQFVDLSARLRTWQAQEAVLLRLMRQATTIESTLRVQNELQDVQFRIEQIKGQLRVLENQTSLATIQVTLREVGAPVVPARTVVNERPSLVEAWDRAVNGFLGVVFAVIVGLGYLIPITALGFAVWFGYRRLRTPAVS